MTVAGTLSKAELLARHVELVLVIPKAWPTYARETPPPPQNYEKIELPVLFSGHNHLHLYLGIRGLLTKIKPDVIHIDEEPYSVVTSQIIAASAGLKAKHIAFTWQNLYKVYPPPFSLFEKYVYKHARAIIAGNSEARTILRKKGYRGYIPIIPQFGIDSLAYTANLNNKEKLGVLPDVLAVAYVGRLVKEKGIDILLGAIAKVPGVHLYIAGSGPEEAFLARLAGEYRISDRVHFMGPLQSTKVAEFMASVDVLVLPSRTRPNWKEQFGRVLIEAMASGTVVIGSNSGEIPNVIGGAGLIFREGDVNELAMHLNALRDPVTRESYIRGGYERVKFYTQDRIVDKTLAVYKAVLDENRTPTS